MDAKKWARRFKEHQELVSNVVKTGRHKEEMQTETNGWISIWKKTREKF